MSTHPNQNQQIIARMNELLKSGFGRKEAFEKAQVEVRGEAKPMWGERGMNLPTPKERQKLAFEKRMNMLIYAVHKKDEFTVRDIAEDVVSVQLMTIRNCLKDLIECGYIYKTGIYTFKATDFAEQLFGVKP